MRLLIAAFWLLTASSYLHAWGDKAHRVIALVAWQQLSPGARAQAEALLRTDDSGLTATDFASQAVWADAYRDSDRDTHRTRYEQTRRWHYINLKLTDPNFADACYGSPRTKSHTAASRGAANACITDKVEQFAAELASPRTPLSERRLALQFLMHLIGDLHQPLHVADNDDAGGNEIQVSAAGLKRGTLHRYWDSTVVNKLGRKPETIARKLIAQTDPIALSRWQRGTPRDWTMETFFVARDIAYAKLPAKNTAAVHTLDDSYTDAAKKATAQQLIKAGVRLAGVMEAAFAAPSTARRDR